ncbi:hypothetical protein SAMN02910358_01221 [Lachnospiraceae bacterium XBB1006]|nr:hypothetical protein SAMN02910358_01221 [Lachnospiraceae bacterium XBB1006]
MKYRYASGVCDICHNEVKVTFVEQKMWFGRLDTPEGCVWGKVCNVGAKSNVQWKCPHCNEMNMTEIKNG